MRKRAKKSQVLGQAVKELLTLSEEEELMSPDMDLTIESHDIFNPLSREYDEAVTIDNKIIISPELAKSPDKSISALAHELGHHFSEQYPFDGYDDPDYWLGEINAELESYHIQRYSGVDKAIARNTFLDTMFSIFYELESRGYRSSKIIKFLRESEYPREAMDAYKKYIRDIAKGMPDLDKSMWEFSALEGK